MSSEVYCGYVCGEQHQVAVEGFVRVGTEEQPLDPCSMRQPTEILGADGTTVNTGHLNGSMRNMELRLGRPLQSTESCVHVTPGGVATEEDVRAPRRPHNWSSELLWPYWKATEEQPTTPLSPKPPLHASTSS